MSRAWHFFNVLFVTNYAYYYDPMDATVSPPEFATIVPRWARDPLPGSGPVDLIRQTLGRYDRIPPDL